MPVELADNCVVCKKEFYYNVNRLIDNYCDTCIIESLEDIKCNGTQRKLCNNINCKRCYYRSFISQKKSLYWSKNNENKNKITPRECFKSSRTERLFNCEDCSHEIKKHWII